MLFFVDKLRKTKWSKRIICKFKQKEENNHPGTLAVKTKERMNWGLGKKWSSSEIHVLRLLLFFFFFFLFNFSYFILYIDRLRKWNLPKYWFTDNAYKRHTKHSVSQRVISSDPFKCNFNPYFQLSARIIQWAKYTQNLWTTKVVSIATHGFSQVYIFRINKY